MSQNSQNLPNKILLVDDDPSIAQGLDEALGRYNIKIDKATSLETALYLFNTNRYDVALIEIEFAPLAGLALVQKWRDHDIVDKRSCAFIMLSGNKSLGNNEGLVKELGDLEVLNKPCSAIQVLPFLSRGMATRKRMASFVELKSRVINYFEKTGDFAKAAELVQKKLPEIGAKGLPLLYDLYEKADKKEEALGLVGPMLERDPSNIMLLNAKGRLLMQLGRFEEAKVALAKADSFAPQNIERLNNLVGAYLELKEPDAAIIKMKELIKLNPEHPDEKFGMFAKLFDHGFDSHAVNFGKEAAKPMEIVRHYNNKGVMMSKDGEAAEALGEYKRALSFYPQFKENYRIYYNVALAQIAHKTRESYVEAQKNLKKCLELSPEFEKAKTILDQIERSLSKKAS